MNKNNSLSAPHSVVHDGAGNPAKETKLPAPNAAQPAAPAPKEAEACTTLTPEQLRRAIQKGDLETHQGCPLSVLTAEARHHYRAGDGKMYKLWKDKAPAFTPAVLCHPTGGHRRQNIAAYTGLLMYDYDHVGSPEAARTLVQRLAREPYTFAAWVTTSGDGVRLLVRYLPDATAATLLAEQQSDPQAAAEGHKRIWQHVRGRLEKLSPHTIDPVTHDATRLSFLCHDAQAHFSLAAPAEENSIVVAAHVLRPLPPKRSYSRQEADDTFTADPHTLALRWLQQRGMHYHEGCRNRYLFDYGCTLCRLGAPQHEALRHALAMHPALPEKEAARTLASAYRTVAAHGQESSLAAHLQPRGRKKQHGTPPPDPDPADDKTGDRDRNAPALALIEERYSVRHNLLTDNVEICPREHTADPNPLMHPYQVVTANGRVISSLWHEINRTLGTAMAKKTVYDLLFSQQVSRSYNPLDDYLRYCHDLVLSRYADRPQSQWPLHPAYRDENGRPIATPWREDEDEIRRLFAAIDSDMPAPLLHWIGTKWMVSLVANALNDEQKGHLMLILQGDGGCGKTKFFKSLAPPHAKETDSLLATTTMARFANKHESREMGILLSKTLLIVVDEFARLGDAESGIIKEAVTCTQIDKRFLHTDHVGQLQRRSTLCGTTNDPVITHDDKAEKRRLIAVHVRHIAHHGILARLPLDLDLLYGQAAWLYHAGLAHWLSPDNPSPDEEALDRYESRFAALPPEAEALLSLFANPARESDLRDADTGLPLVPELLNATEIYNRISYTTRLPLGIGPRHIKRALLDAGFAEKTSRGKRGFLVVEKPHGNRKEEAVAAAHHALCGEKGATA